MWMREKIYLPRQNTKDIYTHYGKIKLVTEEFLCYTKCDGEACVHLLKPQSQAILNNPKMYQCLKYFNMDHGDKVLGLPYHFYHLKISLFLSRTVREIHNPPKKFRKLNFVATLFKRMTCWIEKIDIWEWESSKLKHNSDCCYLL